MSDDKYRVGDVLFVISSKSNQVIPIQVIEEVHSRTLEGEKRTYIVQIGPRGEKPPTEIEKLPKPIFRSAVDVQKYMMQNAATAIDTMLKKSLTSSSKWYVKVNVQQGDRAAADTVTLDEGAFDSVNQESDDEDVQMVQMPDGTIAKVKINIPQA